jgi:hypothetical protein
MRSGCTAAAIVWTGVGKRLLPRADGAVAARQNEQDQQRLRTRPRPSGSGRDPPGRRSGSCARGRSLGMLGSKITRWCTKRSIRWAGEKSADPSKNVLAMGILLTCCRHNVVRRYPSVAISVCAADNRQTGTAKSRWGSPTRRRPSTSVSAMERSAIGPASFAASGMPERAPFLKGPAGTSTGRRSRRWPMTAWGMCASSHCMLSSNLALRKSGFIHQAISRTPELTVCWSRPMAASAGATLPVGVLTSPNSRPLISRHRFASESAFDRRP